MKRFRLFLLHSFLIAVILFVPGHQAFAKASIVDVPCTQIQNTIASDDVPYTSQDFETFDLFDSYLGMLGINEYYEAQDAYTHNLINVNNNANDDYDQPINPLDVPLFDQCDDWGSYLLGTCTGYTICSHGCAITSMAMVLDYFGVELTIPADFSSSDAEVTGMNPAIVNDWLTWKKGYTGGCSITWNFFSEQGVVASERHYNSSNNGIDIETYAFIDKALKNDDPVIARVTSSTAVQHFVVITGREGDTYLINDPKGGEKLTLDTGAWGAYSVVYCHSFRNTWSSDPYNYLKPLPSISSATTDGDGGIIVVGTSYLMVEVQRVDADGNILWGHDGEKIVRDNPSLFNQPSIASDDSKGAYITWSQDKVGIFSQRIDSDGNCLWNNEGVLVSNLGTRGQTNYVLSDSCGGALVGWNDGKGNDWVHGYRYDFYIQRIDSQGESLWQEGGVCVGKSYDRHAFWVVGDGLGGAYILWETKTKPKLQHVDSFGNILWHPDGLDITVNEYSAWNLKISTDNCNGVIVSWLDSNDDNQIYAQRFNYDGNRLWSDTEIPIGSQNSDTCISASYYMTDDNSGGAFFTWGEYPHVDWEEMPEGEPLVITIKVQHVGPNGLLEWDHDVTICNKEQINLKGIEHDTRGGALVLFSYTNWTQDSSIHELYAQYIRENGEIRWGDTGVLISSGSTERDMRSIINENDKTYIVLRYGVILLKDNGTLGLGIHTELPHNRPPRIYIDTEVNVTVNENQPLNINISAVDPENDPVTYSASNLPAGATFDKHTHTFAWTPAAGQAGTYPNIRFSVTDGIHVDFEEITVTVYPLTSGESKPRIIGVSAQYDGDERKDVIGTFISGVTVNNWISADVWHPEGNEAVTSVEFILDDITKTDSNGTDGWSAQFNMGNLENDATLIVKANDTYGNISQEKILLVDIIPMPAWLETSISTGGDFGAWSWSVEFDINETAFLFCGQYKTKSKWDFNVDNCAFFNGDHSLSAPAISVWVKYHMNGISEIGGGASTDFHIFGGDATLSGTITGSLSQALKLAELVGEISLALEYEIPTPWSISLPYFGDTGLIIVVSTEGKLEIILSASPPDEKLVFQQINVPINVEAGAKVKLGDEGLTIIPAYLEIYVLGNGSIAFTYKPSHDPVFFVDNAALGIRGGVTGKLGWSWLGQVETQRELGPHTWSIVDNRNFPEFEQILVEEGWILTPPQNIQNEPVVPSYRSIEEKISIDQTAFFSNDNPDDFPCIATNGSENATIVWVHTTDVGMPPQMNLYYSMLDGDEWAIPSPIETEPNVKLNPSVAYINNAPFVVWTGDQNNIDSVDFTTWVSGLELYYSKWHENAWTAPEAITSNTVGEGMSALSSNGTDAMLVWVADMDNDLDTRNDLELYYSKYDGVTWSIPQELTDNTYSDTSPSISYRGSRAIVTWIQDIDGDDTTINDRQLVCSEWDGSVWSASGTLEPSVIGVSNPKVEFDKDGIPSMVWVSTHKSGNTTSDAVYICTQSEAGWTNPVQISELDAWIKDLNLSIDVNNNIVVSWVRYGNDTGNIYYTVKENLTGLWSPPRQLTDNNMVNWQLSMDSLENDVLLTWLSHETIVTTDGLVSNDDDVYCLRHAVAPDLMIDNSDIVTSDNQPSVGDTITINATVHNHGDLQSGSSTIRFFDGNPDDSGTQIGIDQIVNSLPVEGYHEFSIDWEVQAGKNEIYVQIDPDNTLREITKENNTAVISLNCLPDLAVTSKNIQFSNITPVTGDSVVISATINNKGGMDASGVIVRFFNGNPATNGIQIGEDCAIETIILGGNVTVSGSFIAAPGQQTIYVTIDPDNLIDEYIKDNNIASQSVSVLPDLGLTSNDIEVSTELSGEGRYHVQVSALVHNYGGADSDNFTVRFYDGNPFLDGALIAEESIEQLIINETLSLTVTYEVLSESSGNIFIVVDILDEIKEWNEDNNIADKSIFKTEPLPSYSIHGEICEVNDNILPGANITTSAGVSVISNPDGTYELELTTTGTYTVTANKSGYRSQSQTITITDLTDTYTLDFKGNDGLVPNAPNISYVLACVNRWKFPRLDGTGLDMSKVLSVISAWKYPIQ